MNLLFLKKNLRSIIYGLIIAFSITFIQHLAHDSTSKSILIGIIIVSLILIINIFITFKIARKLLSQLGLPNTNIYSKRKQIFYHAILPLILLFSIIGFIITNNIMSLSLIYFIINFLIFTTIFINIRAYYEDKFKLEENTHAIFDIIKLTIYFTTLTTILNITNQYSVNFFIKISIIFIIATLLSLITILDKKHISIINILLVILAGLALGYLTSSLELFINTGTTLISFYSTLIFYILNAIIYHEIERTLKLSTLIEYILVTAIGFLIILLMP